jgi:hypothetical protein
VRDYCGVATRVRASAGAAAGTRVPVSPMPLPPRPASAAYHDMRGTYHIDTHDTRREAGGACGAVPRTYHVASERD